MAVDHIETLPRRQRAIKVVEAGSIRLVKDASLPELDEEDVLVRVHCVALNPFDWYYSRGRKGQLLTAIDTDSFNRKSLDLSPAPGSTFGCDVAGEVVAIGSKCRESIQVGDRVFGPVKGNASDAPGNGGFAEYAAIREIVAWKMPKSMEYAQAATMGMSLMTVGLALHYTLKVPLPSSPPTSTEKDEPGRYVFIYGAGTATGTLAIQCAAL